MSILNNTTNLQSLLEQANALPEASGGVELPTLSNEGSAGDLLSGKQLIDSDGEIVTGTIPTKTSSNLTASGATVTVPAGYYASDASKSVSTATQATPSVSIDSAGKITASATQTAGYVSAGTKTGTKQLTTQAGKTVTPSASEQTAVASGRYTTGAVTVAGDSNLVADNIKSGVSIFNVIGSYVGDSATLERGTITGITPYYEEPNINVYYYDLSSFPDKTMVCLYFKSLYDSGLWSDDIIVCIKDNTTDTFQVVLYSDLINKPEIDSNVLMAHCYEYEYCAV